MVNVLLLVTAEEVERIKRTVEGWDLDFDKVLGGELLQIACAQSLHRTTSLHTGPWHAAYGRVALL